MLSKDEKQIVAQIKADYPEVANESDEDVYETALELGWIQQPQLPAAPVSSEVEILLPAVPQPRFGTSVDIHTPDLIDNYHSGKGWMFVKGQENRTRFAELLADQQQHLARLQTAANAAEAESYLRVHKLWTLEIEAVLRAEQAQTEIIQQRGIRYEGILNTRLADVAATTGRTVATDQKIKEAAALKQVEYEDHQRREELAVKLKEQQLRLEAEFIKTLSDPAEVKRAETLRRIKELIQMREAEPFLEMKQIYQKEIDLKTEELFSDAGLVRQADATGQDPSGGSEASDSGRNTKLNEGTPEKPISPRRPRGENWVFHSRRP